MITANVFSWKKLFYFCLGLFVASAFCMKWIEPAFISKGREFSIMDLELWLDKNELKQLLQGLDDKTRTIVNYHLHFDFFFMAGVFPGIASICMLAGERIPRGKQWLRAILFVFAVLQLAAWSLDIYENAHLIKWLNDPGAIDKDSIGLYHLLVKLKFVLALAGVFIAVVGFLFSRNKMNTSKT